MRLYARHDLGLPSDADEADVAVKEGFDEVQKFGPTVREGRVTLDDRPGLGIELDWDYVKKHPYQRLLLRTFTDHDGSLPLI